MRDSSCLLFFTPSVLLYDIPFTAHRLDLKYFPKHTHRPHVAVFNAPRPAQPVTPEIGLSMKRIVSNKVKPSGKPSPFLHQSLCNVAQTFFDQRGREIQFRGAGDAIDSDDVVGLL